MPAVAFCKFALETPNLTDQLRLAHEEYIRNNSKQIFLAATLRAGDELNGLSEYNQCSLYVTEHDVGELKELAARDPYFTAGVCPRVEFYSASPFLGVWSAGFAEQFERMSSRIAESDMIPSLPSGRKFAVVSTFGDQTPTEAQGEGHGKNSARNFKRMLLAIPLEYAESVGVDASARPHRSVYIYQGADIDDVRKMVASDPLTRDRLWTLRAFDIEGLAGTFGRHDAQPA